MKEKLLVLAVAYPEESRKYRSTLCIAGITEDGVWRRLYPVPFTTYLGLNGIPKRGWIEYEFRDGGLNDKRKESKTIEFKTIRKIHGGKTLGAEEVREILRPQITTLEHLTEKHHEDWTSLGIIKPELIDMGFKPNKSYTAHRQTNLSSRIIQVTQLKDKPQYHFKCHGSDGCKAHNIICEDIEAGELYRKYVNKEDIRHEKMKDKLFYRMQKYDLHFFVGTHSRFSKWLIIGLFYPDLPDDYRQLSLAN